MALCWDNMDDVDSDSGSDNEPTSRGVTATAAVLVQTCDKYSWFWPAWHFFFHRCVTPHHLAAAAHTDHTVSTPGLRACQTLTLWFSAWKAGWEVYLMTEELDAGLPGVHVLRTGRGCFSDRLATALAQMNHTYVLYVQDDFWPIQQCPALTFHQLLVRRLLSQAPKLPKVASGTSVEGARHVVAPRPAA